MPVAWCDMTLLQVLQKRDLSSSLYDEFFRWRGSGVCYRSEV